MRGEVVGVCLSGAQANRTVLDSACVSTRKAVRVCVCVCNCVCDCDCGWDEPVVSRSSRARAWCRPPFL